MIIHLIFVLIPIVSQTLLDVGCIAADGRLTVPYLCGAYILGGCGGLQVCKLQ